MLRQVLLPLVETIRVRRTRRGLVGAVLCGALTAGCASRGDGSGSTPRETPTLETRIELHSVVLSAAEREQIEPLSFESLPADERRIIAAAADGGFSVSYGRSEYPTDGGRTAGLSSLISRVVDRLNDQTRTYESENPTATAANPPSHVSAVYVRYEGQLYCLDVVDGDQKYYHCPRE